VIKVKFQHEDVTEVKRMENNIFKCKCEKCLRFSNSLRRYVKGYNDELTEPEEGALMNILENSDVSESINMNNRIIPTDCIDALISQESADYRERRIPENRMYYQ
jgi:hypothetical protein